MQTNLLKPQIQQGFRLGCSLQYAYQPATHADIKTCYDHHPCQACGNVSISESVPDAGVLQVDSIRFQILNKSCSCGYDNEILVILNNVLATIDPSIMSAEDAIAQAEARHQLPDPLINAQLIAAQVAIHHQRYDRAIAINQALTIQHPELFVPFYNLGVLYSQQGRYPEAITAYCAALEHNPHHSESLSSKAFALLQCSQLREAGATYEQWRQQNPSDIVILARMEGCFGTVQVIDYPDHRSLCINQQVQGAVYKIPTAPQFEPSCRPGPGTLAQTRYSVGSLLLGYQMRRSHGLVLGLGCGAALGMNLACFPELRITVIELDPVVIRLCLTFFPLVQHYVDQGRLAIIEADALTFLQSNDQPFDFVQFDLYQGLPEVPSPFRSVDGIQQMGATAPLLFSNIIGNLNDSLFHQVLENFDRAGYPIHTLYPSQPIEENESTDLNWLATTQPFTIPEHFVPFSDVLNEPANIIQQHFKQFQENAISRKSLLVSH